LKIALLAGLALAVNPIVSFVNIKRLLEDFNWSPILSQGKVFKNMVFFFFFFFYINVKKYLGNLCALRVVDLKLYSLLFIYLFLFYSKLYNFFSPKKNV
jgi:hypothetical protein